MWLFSSAWTRIAGAGKWIADGGWKALGVAAAALLLAFSVWSWTAAAKDRDAAQTALKQAQEDITFLQRAGLASDRAVTGNQAAKTAINQREQTGLAQTEAALSANPEWASQPVPPAVLDSLRE